MVYLDLARRGEEASAAQAILDKLEGILEIYEKFVGTDPLDEPMKIFPAVHYSMGGLWAGFTKDEKTGGLKMRRPDEHDDQHPRPVRHGRGAASRTTAPTASAPTRC